MADTPATNQALQADLPALPPPVPADAGHAEIVPPNPVATAQLATSPTSSQPSVVVGQAQAAPSRDPPVSEAESQAARDAKRRRRFTLSLQQTDATLSGEALQQEVDRLVQPPHLEIQ